MRTVRKKSVRFAINIAVSRKRNIHLLYHTTFIYLNIPWSLFYSIISNSIYYMYLFLFIFSQFPCQIMRSRHFSVLYWLLMICRIVYTNNNNGFYGKFIDLKHFFALYWHTQKNKTWYFSILLNIILGLQYSFLIYDEIWSWSFCHWNITPSHIYVHVLS